jgi:hypothetical protein
MMASSFYVDVYEVVVRSLICACMKYMLASIPFVMKRLQRVLVAKLTSHFALIL